MLISILGRICNNTVNKKQIQPSVSFIIAAHNEESCIREKIENTLQLRYPKKKLEIIVASDCSTDNTNDIVKEFKDKGVILYEQTERLGKTSAQIAAVRMSQGEILVFTDASTICDENSILLIVRNFSDQDVGCVGGRVVFIDDAKPDATARKIKKNIIADIEQAVRDAESKIYATPCVNGPLYAIKRSSFREIDPCITADDFGFPLDVLMRGYRVVYERDAVAYQGIKRHDITLKRNIRTINQGWVALQLLNLKALLFRNFKRFGYIFFVLLGHKLLRWVSFVFLILLFVTNVFLILEADHFFYSAILLLQTFFYLIALAGLLFRFQNKVLSIPYRFCLYHYAAFIAFTKFCKGEKIIVWD